MKDKDKLDKLVAEIERLYHQSLVDENRQAEWGLSSAACTSCGKSKACKELLSFIDSMQKEPKECMYSKDNYTNEDRKALCDGCKEECKFNKNEEPANDSFEAEVKKLWEEINTGHSYSIVDSYNQFYGLCMEIADWQKEQIIKRLCNHANIDQMVEKFEDKYKPKKVLDTEYYKRGIFDTIKAIKED